MSFGRSSGGASTAAAATAAATVSAATAESATSTTAASSALARLVDGERTAAVVTTIEVANGAVGVFGASHFYEPEAARTAGVAIRDEFDLDDVASVLCE
jgi:hypothetical protein